MYTDYTPVQITNLHKLNGPIRFSCKCSKEKFACQYWKQTLTLWYHCLRCCRFQERKHDLYHLRKKVWEREEGNRLRTGRERHRWPKKIPKIYFLGWTYLVACMHIYVEKLQIFQRYIWNDEQYGVTLNVRGRQNASGSLLDTYMELSRRYRLGLQGCFPNSSKESANVPSKASASSCSHALHTDLRISGSENKEKGETLESYSTVNPMPKMTKARRHK